MRQRRKPYSAFVRHNQTVHLPKASRTDAYFGEAGIAFERRVSRRIEVGGSFNTGWASATFNDAYIGIDKSALNLTGIEGCLTVYVKPHFYIGPHVQFTTTLDRAVRAQLAQPTLFFVGLVTGVEFQMSAATPSRRERGRPATQSLT